MIYVREKMDKDLSSPRRKLYILMGVVYLVVAFSSFQVPTPQPYLTFLVFFTSAIYFLGTGLAAEPPRPLFKLALRVVLVLLVLSVGALIFSFR